MHTTFEERVADATNLAECRALVRRITRSAIFAKSERLSSLLTYICDVTLQGKSKDLNEQKIGAAVFGRNPDYDSSIDGIVRTQASRLRTRLSQFFQDEGANEPIQIVIPRGGYIPFFEPRLPMRLSEEQKSHPARSTACEVEIPISKPDTEAGSGSEEVVHSGLRTRLLWFIAAVLLGVVIVVGFIERPAILVIVNRQKSADLLWSTLFPRGKSTLLVYGDSGLVMWHGSNNRNIELTEYMGGEYRAVDGAATTLLSPFDLSNRRYTSVVDLEVVHALDRIAANWNGTLDVRFARDARPNDLKQGNVILIGASEANPWVGLFEPHMNFTFVNDRVHQTMSVLNRSPRPGEPRQWDSKYMDAEHKVFGVVAFLPNLNGNGNVLLMEGTSMAGTESAWDFVSDERQFDAFLKQLGSTNHQLHHFEVVLGTNNFGGSAAKTTVLAWRKLD
jgi:hypothetical protein